MPSSCIREVSLDVDALGARRDMLHALVATLVSVVLTGGLSAARAASCTANGQGEIVNGGGAACTLPAGATVPRITASNNSVVQANGVSVVVPYGTAITAQSGGSVLLGIDPVAGAPKLSEQFAGSGGITGLLASGPNSLITASGINVSLPASGITVARAEAGGQITLDSNSTINVSPGGGSQTLVATGPGSRIIANDTVLSGSTGGGDITVHSTLGGRRRIGE